MSTTFPTSLNVIGYVDLNKSELRNAVVQNLASAPSSPMNGQIYFNTTSNLFYIWNGSAWVTWYPSTTTLNNIAAPTGDVSLNSQKITNLANGVSAADAVNLSQLQGVAAGVSWKQSVRVATTANGTLASAFQNGSTVDGVSLSTGDRILLKNQSSGAENGIYTVNASGAPTRATDADTGAELRQAACFVEEGTTNADSAWVCTTNAPITPGSTALTFVQFTGSSYTFTSGVQLVGSTVSANVDNTTIEVNGSNQLTAKGGSGGVARKYEGAISGNGSAAAFVITHNLGTKRVLVSVVGTSSPYTDQVVYPDISTTSTTQVTIAFSSAPASGVNFAVNVVG